MKSERLSVKSLCLLTIAGAMVSMAIITAVISILYNDVRFIFPGILMTLCTLAWMLLLVHLFGRNLSLFTNELCVTLDNMISGAGEPVTNRDLETLFARISHRLMRLYGIMQENRRRVEAERRELQALISDISHQVKTPVSNLRMVTDTLLTREVTDIERREFLQGISRQTEKLSFLFQALVKTSRLETGAIRLVRTDGLLFDTLAQAMSGIVYSAELKHITVDADCPGDLRLCHDSKWTAEALFNLLDNAVKYTPSGGQISVTARKWEVYVKIDITDTGKGIPESHQAFIFQRFYREEEVHDEPGVGIGLYLAREIITRQGGYIKVLSEPGKGSVFSVFLPYR